MTARAIKIAVMALGGQGGGVLADWIVKAGERAGFLAQSTSVPGVAQRTGATIYYVELFPLADAEQKGMAPILALMPAPGDVDIVIAAELMEAGRALARGFVSDKTTIIASTHRVYAIDEKVAMSDGRLDSDAVRGDVSSSAGRAIWMDMDAMAADANSVISAVMLGALAGSGAAPITREDFEAVIREGGRAVERNLRAFGLGFEAAATATPAALSQASPRATPSSPAVAPLLARIEKLPAPVRALAREGARRAVDFQDMRYAEDYLARIEQSVAIDEGCGGAARGFTLSKAIAKYLALAIAYDDVIRVADLKTRAARFARVREDVRVERDQIVRIVEFMHPRLEEVCDLLPPRLADNVMQSRSAQSLFGRFFGKGRRVATSDLGGYLMLSMIASLRGIRRGTSRYSKEQARIAEWLALILAEAPRDYALAVEIAGLHRLIKGYGDTHARGLANFGAIVAVLDATRRTAAPAATLARLRDAAMKDEAGVALRGELQKLDALAAAA